MSREPAERQPLLDIAFETMSSTLEELRVAEEEMRHQNDALAAANVTIETWRRYYEDLFAAAPDAYLVTDMNGVVQASNQAANHLLGISQRFLEGKPLVTFVAQGERQIFRDLLTDLTHAAGVVEHEITWQPRKRVALQSVVTVSVSRDPRGNPLSLRWLIRNVTGRVEAETERYRLLVDAVEDYSILLLDTNGCVVNWNPGATLITGYTEAEMRGQSVEAIFTPEDRARGIPVQEMKIAASEGRAEDDRWHQRKDGIQFWASGVMLALRARTGELLYYAKVFRDFTARKDEQERLAREYEREHYIAATLQQTLLPLLAEDVFPGITINCQYQVARAEAQVGGDFYDAFQLDGEIALVVGDVSGKGLAAAAHTAETKYALRAFLRETPAPDRAMERLNTFLYDSQRFSGTDDVRFVTLCVLVIDSHTGRMSAAVAGAEPPLVLRADGTTETVAVNGNLLGMERESQYLAATVTLNPGDTVVLVTDGITEARRDREFLDYEGLVRLAQAARDCPTLQETGQTILDGARAFAEGRLSDDACLLLARRV